MNFRMKVHGHDFVSEQCKWNCPPMVWNVPSWPLKGDNWKIQDEATVKVGTLCSAQVVVEKMGMNRRNVQTWSGNVNCLNLKCCLFCGASKSIAFTMCSMQAKPVIPMWRL